MRYEHDGKIFEDIESEDLVGMFHDNRTHLYAIQSNHFFEHNENKIGVLGVLPDIENETENQMFQTDLPESLQGISIKKWLSGDIIGEVIHIANEDWIVNAVDLHISERAYNKKLNTCKVYVELHVHHVSNDNEGLPADGIDTRYFTQTFHSQFTNNDKKVNLAKPIHWRLNRKAFNGGFLNAGSLIQGASS